MATVMFCCSNGRNPESSARMLFDGPGTARQHDGDARQNLTLLVGHEAGHRARQRLGMGGEADGDEEGRDQEAQ
jgi:hypothetical protein